MKIRVLVDTYQHQGLYKGSEHDALWDEGTKTYNFVNYGKLWTLGPLQAVEVELLKGDDFPAPNENLLDVINTDLKQQGPIKSDGGSSSYYDLNIPEWLLYTLNERQKDGKCYIKTEEMIQVFFGNDFSVGNMFKATVRGYQSMKGAGKNDLSYEVKKIQYYANRMLQHAQQGDGVGT